MIYRKMFPLLYCLWLLTSCHGQWAQIFSQDEGVPLQRFVARDGAYFPDFILKFFPGAVLFTQDFPSLAEAKSQVRLIQVKRLTDNDQYNTNEANLSWSADGVYLSYEIVDEQMRQIQVKSLEGDYAKVLALLPKERQQFLEGMVVRAIQSYNAGLSWSQDSTRFAFMSNGGIGEYNIYVGAVGQKERIIAQSPAKDGMAAWNPIRDEIVFVSSRTGSGDLYLIDLKTQEILRLTNSENVDLFPVWFPNGNQIVFARGDAHNHDIMLMERRNGIWRKPYRLTEWDEDDLRPRVSPDGQYVAFYSSDTGHDDYNGGARKWNIYVVPIKNRQTYTAAELKKHLVAEDVVVDLNTGPCWSPDSEKIFYVKRDPALYNPIYAYDIFSGRRYLLETKTKMNRDLMISHLGVLSFRAQVGAWDRVFLALTNQGKQLQQKTSRVSKLHYIKSGEGL